MPARNPHLAKLQSGYLFPEINKKKRAYLEKNPGAELISLGIGDTTEPLSESVVDGLVNSAKELGEKATYSGYGPEQGLQALREKISEVIYQGRISEEDIFISDGSKCDIGRLQLLFGNTPPVHVQNPSYPVYVDTSLISGHGHIEYHPCREENNFFPELKKTAPGSIFYFCSPNNPTGAAATKKELEKLVSWALSNKSFIVYDAAYAAYIQDKNTPKSIYEIEGSHQCAIEVGSFSKLAGFTGVRLGWVTVPQALLFEEGDPVKNDWSRIHSTFFNGASILSQKGALAALSPEGQKEIRAQIAYYLENAAILKKTLKESGYKVFGGDNAPYLWVSIPNKSSWDAFQYFLEECQIVTTPGSGFGSEGEGYIRFSAYGSRENILAACERLKCALV